MRPIASYIDHTLLKPTATPAQIEELCQQAIDYQFASVCVNGVHVKQAAELLAEADVAVCTVVGFPLGAMAIEAKAYETRLAIQNGATEIDMVLYIGGLKAGHHDAVRDDIAAIVAECAPTKAISKVIMETAMLTDEEKVTACKLAKEAGADFVKTSTGFGGGGATIEDIRLMRETVGPEMGVKASGGVRDLATAQAMVEAGATRIGASAGVAIVKEERGEAGAASSDGY